MDINQWTGEPNKPVFYTKEMARKVREIKKPFPNLDIDIVKFPDFLAIRLYEDNIAQFEDSKRVKVINYVQMVKDLIETYGVRCELEGVKGGRTLR